MAEPISIQQLKDASLDVKSLGEVVNGDENVVVTTRLGETYPSVKGSIKKVFENGGLPATPFATKALMTASALADGKYAMVTDDTVNSGLYVKTAGTWVKSNYDPLTKALAYIDSSQTIEQSHKADEFTVLGSYVMASSGVLTAESSFTATDFIRVEPNIIYKYSLSTSPFSGAAFYDENKIFISGFGNNSTGAELSVTTPNNARYVRLSNRNTNTAPYFKAFGRYNIDKITSIVNTLPKNELLKQVHTSNAYAFDDYVHIDTGVFLASALHKRTDYIRVESGVSYGVLSIGKNNAACAWYDKDKQYISGFRAETKTTVTSPTNAHYVALSVLTENLSSAYIKSSDERFNLVKLESAVNAIIPEVSGGSVTPINIDLTQAAKDKPMLFDTVVKSKEELQSVKQGGTSDKAYPIGRRVYDHSLRSEVYADGMFWRLPDGTAASLARRVYVYPDWLEIKAALPTYAKAYKKLYDVSTGTDNWTKKIPSSDTATYMSDKFGDSRLCIEHKSGVADYVYLNNGSALNLNSYLIFDYHVDLTKTYFADIEVALFSADGTLLFRRILLSSIMGTNPRAFYDIDHVKAEVKVSTLTAAFEGASLADVRHIGFSVARRGIEGAVGRIYLGNIETVSFKPMVTLRFDDQRKSVYTNALSIMNQFGFKGLIAVVTGAPELGNHPDMTYRLDGMTKEELLEVQELGWDLVSHTDSHMAYEDKSDEYIRNNYRTSRDYLRDELNVGDIASSCLIAPYGRRNERAAMIQREFFDCGVDQSQLNSHMPRQPEGTWQTGSLWMGMGAAKGDTSNAAQLIAHAQKAIDEERWQIYMFHDILETPTESGAATNVTPADFLTFCQWLDANRDKIDVVTVTDVVRKIRPVG